VAEFRHWPKSGLDAVRLSANRRENRHPGPPEVGKRSFLVFKSNSDAVIPHSKAPVPFFDPPRNLYDGSAPGCDWFQFSIHPSKADFDFPFVRDAAGCRTPGRRSRAARRPAVRAPSDLRSGSRPWGSPDARACIGVEPRHRRPRSRDSNISPGPPPAKFAVSLVIAEGNRRIGRLAEMPLVRQWQVGCHSKSLLASLRACVAIHGGGGVVQAWLVLGSIRFPAPAPPQGIKWTTTCLAAMIFVCIRTVSVWMEGSSTFPIRPYERRDWKRSPLSEYRICTSVQKLHLRPGRLGCV